MTKSIARSLCESRYRWLIVISVTLGVGLTTLLPLADDYLDGKTEKSDCLEELRNARLEVADLGKLKSRIDQLKSELVEIEGRTVSESTVSEYRGRLVDFARTSGCQLRRITVGDGQTRPWRDGDDPVDSKGKAEEQLTGLILERQPLVISVSGTVSGLKSLLEQMRNERLLMHVRSMELRPTGQTRKQVTLDLELWFFDLHTKTAAAT